MISDHASPLAAQGGVDAGGQNVYVAQLTQRLAAHGFEVDVFTRRDDPDLPEVVQWRAGARVVHVPAGPPRPIAKEELLPHMPAFTQFVRRVCARRRYDVVHAHFWMSGMTAMEIKLTLGTPFVITFHALGRIRRAHQGGDDRFPDSRFEIEERIVRAADRIVAECPQDRADLMNHYGAVADRISVVPCGFDPAELAPVAPQSARAALGIQLDAFVVLQLGRLVPRKGVDTAIDGFARFARTAAANARLLIVGGDSRRPDPLKTPEIGRLQGVASRAGIADRVTFIGQRDRDVLRYYYSAADVFVTLPWYEPFGITPLEAMACAIPVIGSRVGGIKYTVQDRVTGCLIPPDDPVALARCLTTLHGNAPLRQVMGRSGRARVVQHFTWEHVTAAIEETYAHAVNERWMVSQPAAAGGGGKRFGSAQPSRAASPLHSARRTSSPTRAVGPGATATRRLTDSSRRSRT